MLEDLGTLSIFFVANSDKHLEQTRGPLSPKQFVLEEL